MDGVRKYLGEAVNSFHLRWEGDERPRGLIIHHYAFYWRPADRMHSWMDECTEGMDGCSGGWMDGCSGGWMDGCMSEWKSDLVKEWVCAGKADVCMEMGLSWSSDTERLNRTSDLHEWLSRLGKRIISRASRGFSWAWILMNTSPPVNCLSSIHASVVLRLVARLRDYVTLTLFTSNKTTYRLRLLW